MYVYVNIYLKYKISDIYKFKIGMSFATGEITSLDIVEFGNVNIMRSNVSEIDIIQNRLTSNITLNSDLIPSSDSTFIIGNENKRIGNIRANVTVTDMSVTNDYSYLNGSIITGGVITPTILSTNQNNYDPAGLDTCSIIRVSSTTPVSLTGLQRGVNGRRIVIVNVGSFKISLVTESAGSTADNRFNLGGINANLVAGSTIAIIYDGVISRWRISGSAGGAASSSGGLIQTVWKEVTTDTSTSVETWPTANTTIRTATALPVATLPVNSTATFPATGKIRLLNTAGNFQTLTYTSVTGGPNPTFNGVAGGTGTVPIGSTVWLFAFNTTVAAGSNGATLPQSIINVVSTATFPTSGKFLVDTTIGYNLVTYTGKTATSFTGCTGGTGILATANEVRDVTPNAQDFIRIEFTSLGGDLIILSSASAIVSNNKIAFLQIVIDGLIIRGGATSGNGSAPGGSTVIGLKVSNVPAGDHVVLLRWRVNNNATAAISPVTSSEFTNANILIQEVTM